MSQKHSRPRRIGHSRGSPFIFGSPRNQFTHPLRTLRESSWKWSWTRLLPRRYMVQTFDTHGICQHFCWNLRCHSRWLWQALSWIALGLATFLRPLFDVRHLCRFYLYFGGVYQREKVWMACLPFTVSLLVRTCYRVCEGVWESLGEGVDYAGYCLISHLEAGMFKGH